MGIVLLVVEWSHCECLAGHKILSLTFFALKSLYLSSQCHVDPNCFNLLGASHVDSVTLKTVKLEVNIRKDIH